MRTATDLARDKSRWTNIVSIYNHRPQADGRGKERTNERTCHCSIKNCNTHQKNHTDTHIVSYVLVGGFFSRSGLIMPAQRARMTDKLQQTVL